ncbi:MAG: pyridoxal kinase PdxY [Spirochaetaceae bacterium]|jgi:pyridoxine kinase|nr:pyridoxal kinase PdxY [Spirochaetaceae bacterium]
MAILSIQSHVVYGTVGNSSAVFPLQRLGNEVWAVNTVEFSNHTGYGKWRGSILSPALTNDILLGLSEHGVLEKCSALISGYLGDPEIGLSILNAVTMVKAANKNALYCCDPVMGDYGKGFYVHKDIPRIIKEQLIPYADILTPNQFELEALSGLETTDISAAKTAIEILHNAGPRLVLVTSYKDRQDNPQEISMLVSNAKNIWRITTPCLPFSKPLSGSGDLTSAVFLSNYLQTGDPVKTLENTASSVYGILSGTYKAKSPELLTVAFQQELVSPSNTFKAEKLF